MRACFAAILITLLFVAPAAAEPADDLRVIISEYEAYARAADPLRAAARGDIAARTVWPDDTPNTVALRRGALEGLQTRLIALEDADLPEADALERDILADRIAVSLMGHAFDEERMPFISGEGFFINPDLAATLTVLNTEAEAEAWLTRMAAIPVYFDQQKENMRRGMRRRFTQPRLVVENSIRSVRAQAELPDAQSPLLAPLARLPQTMPEETRERLYARGAEIYARQVKPALAELATFLERDYLPRARADLGASSLSREYYRYAVRRHTTTTMTPEQIHRLGLAEVARVRAEMDTVIAETGFDGSFAEFLAFLRTDPQFYPRDAEHLMEISSEIANRANAALPRFFVTLPRNTYAVVFIPAALEGGSAGYWGGNPLEGVPGQVLLRRTGAETRTLYDLPAWIMHEGSPGHHTQIALAEELSGLPEYRRNDDVTAFVEGWALYAERLGEEMDIYRTPYERFGRLSMEMWRACRLIMDTGIHWMGWSREQALACLRDNSALAPATVEAETDRYIGWPGQALAYKLGEIEIRNLRAEAERTLGRCFDLRAFHDALLGAGPMPLSVLRARMQRRTAAQSCPAQ